MGEAFGYPEELKVVAGGLGFEVESGPSAEVGGSCGEGRRRRPRYGQRGRGRACPEAGRVGNAIHGVRL